MSADIEQRVANLEELAADVREFTKYLREMMRRYDERLDEGQVEQSHADERIAALADAQIQTEAALAQLTARTGDTDERIAALVNAQIKTEDALQRLAASVARHTGDGHGGQGA